MEKYLDEVARFKRTKSLKALSFIVNYIFKGIRKETGWNYFHIISDFLSTRKRLNINPHEYFLYSLYSEKMPQQYREKFVSRTTRDKFLERINPLQYILLARNKYITKMLLKSLGIPTPELLFLYDPQAGLDSATVLNNPKSVETRLLQISGKQFIVKVLEGEHGKGINVYNGIEMTQEGFRALHLSGEIHSISQLLDFAGKGQRLIFEEKVKQSEAFSSLNPTSVNTVRMLTFLHPNGEADLLLSFIRIGRQGRWVDNAGKGGNVMATINKKTGRLENIISYINYKSFVPLTHHPDSGINLEEFKIENWDGLLDQVLDFHRKLSWLKAIGWDIAITDSGPVVIEINNRWDLIGQTITREGWFDSLSKLDNEWKLFENQ